MATKVVSSADVHDSAKVGDGTSVWHLAQVRENAVLGKNCVIGRGAYIGAGVHLGDNCKVQNYALLYEPASLADGVFIGPAVVLTNDTYPRAITPAGELKSASDWQPVGVTIERGASVGARTVCVAPLNVGEWALIAAGSVVTRDVPAYALVAGVPARRVGWVGRTGVKLTKAGSGVWACPDTGERFREDSGSLTPLED